MPGGMIGRTNSRFAPIPTPESRAWIRQPQAAGPEDPVDTVNISPEVSAEVEVTVPDRPLPVLTLRTGEEVRLARLSEELEVPSRQLPISRHSALRRILQDDSGRVPVELAVLIYGWVHQNQEILDSLQITSLETMTPEQAALLAVRFVQDQLAYDDNTTASDLSDPQVVYNNLIGGTGVCRHYSIATRVVFNVFRRYAQGPLSNAHMMWLIGRADDLADERTNMHGWVLLLTQVSANEFVMQAIDPTTEDQTGEAVEAVQDGLGTVNLGTQLELTYVLQQQGVISSSEAIRVIQEYIENYSDSSRLEWAYYYAANIFLANNQQSEAIEYLAHVVELGGRLSNNAAEMLAQM